MITGVWSTEQDVYESFGITGDSKWHIIYACYAGYESTGYDYEMWARILYVEKTSIGYQLYEIHASHCSCYGLEDQWEPQAVSLDDIISDINRAKAWEKGIADLKQSIIDVWPEVTGRFLSNQP